MVAAAAEVTSRPGWGIDHDPLTVQVLSYVCEHGDGVALTAGLHPVGSAWAGWVVFWTGWAEVGWEWELEPALLAWHVATVEQAAGIVAVDEQCEQGRSA